MLSIDLRVSRAGLHTTFMVRSEGTMRGDIRGSWSNLAVCYFDAPSLWRIQTWLSSSVHVTRYRDLKFVR